MTTPSRYKARQIAQTIREQGRSVTWVARQIGVSRQYTSDVVHGHRTVTEPMARRISGVLGMPFFLGWELSGDNSARNSTEEAA